jgi:hypothetical protein
MINKTLDGGFIAQYAINKAEVKVVLVNSLQFVTVDLRVSFISVIGNLNRFIFDILAK